MIKNFLVAILLVATSSLTTAAQNDNFVEVIGSATTVVKPDIAYISILLSDSDPAIKSSGVEKAEDNLYNALNKLKLSPKENLTINNAYSNAKNRRDGIISKSYTLKLTDVTKISELLDELEAKRIMNVKILQFEVSNADEIKLKLRAEAVKNGQKKAKVLIEAAGAKISHVISIIDSERDHYYPTMIRYNSAADSNSNESIERGVNPEITGQKFSVNVTTKWKIEY